MPDCISFNFPLVNLQGLPPSSPLTTSPPTTVISSPAHRLPSLSTRATLHLPLSIPNSPPSSPHLHASMQPSPTPRSRPANMCTTLPAQPKRRRGGAPARARRSARRMATRIESQEYNLLVFALTMAAVVIAARLFHTLFVLLLTAPFVSVSIIAVTASYFILSPHSILPPIYPPLKRLVPTVAFALPPFSLLQQPSLSCGASWLWQAPHSHHHLYLLYPYNTSPTGASPSYTSPTGASPSCARN